MDELSGSLRDPAIGFDRGLLAAEQIRFEDPKDVTNAALVDRWGRAYRIGVNTFIGRDVQGPGLQIFDPSVSRCHARIDFENDAWAITDFASRNGTRVDDVPVNGTATLRGTVRVRIAHVGFLFVADASGLAIRQHRRATSDTSALTFAEPPGTTTEMASPTWIPTVTFVLHSPTGGGGCLAEIDGKPIQLTTPQHELLSLLIDRMLGEAAEDEARRGFVPMSELVVRLSLDAEPSETNVRQLVKRVRRALLRAGIPDVIESRHGRGYRLRVIPRVSTTR